MKDHTLDSTPSLPAFVETSDPKVTLSPDAKLVEFF